MCLKINQVIYNFYEFGCNKSRIIFKVLNYMIELRQFNGLLDSKWLQCRKDEFRVLEPACYKFWSLNRLMFWRFVPVFVLRRFSGGLQKRSILKCQYATAEKNTIVTFVCWLHFIDFPSLQYVTIFYFIISLSIGSLLWIHIFSAQCQYQEYESSLLQITYFLLNISL